MEINQPISIPIDSRSKWNEDQRVLVEKGCSYEITVDTEQIWYDKNVPSTVLGTTGNVINRIGALLKMKRSNSAKWMSLMCSLDKKEPYIEVGGYLNYQCDSTGYLYFFANDAWNFYGNNSGVVTIKVERRV